MPDKPRYYTIRDRWRELKALYDRLRSERRYWLADRLRNAAGSAGVGVMGGVWFDRDAYEEDSALFADINGIPGSGVRLDMPRAEGFRMELWPPGGFYMGAFGSHA